MLRDEQGARILAYRWKTGVLRCSHRGLGVFWVGAVIEGVLDLDFDG